MKKPNNLPAKENAEKQIEQQLRQYLPKASDTEIHNVARFILVNITSVTQQVQQVSINQSHNIINPKTLKEFDQVLPGAADRMLTLTEKQQEHRHHLEKTAVEGNSNREKLSLWTAASVAGLAITGSTMIALFTDWTAAGVIGIVGTIAVLAGVFITGKALQIKELRLGKRGLQINFGAPPNNPNQK